MIHEPRKSIPQGIIILKAVECLAGIFVNYDIVCLLDQQWQKKFSMTAVTSPIPLGEDISYNTVAVLRQTVGSNVVRN